MILVSCRRSFDSNRLFAGANEIRHYASLQRLEAYEVLSAAELGAAVAGRHVLVLVHGFRNPLEHVAASYADLERGLLRHGLVGDDGYGMVVGFAWPGFQTSLGFFPAIPWANRSAGYLRALLRQLARHAMTVDVQTHSLGARVALQALAFTGDAWVDTLLLTAPAVDDEVLEPEREFHASLASCRRCIAYYSTGDPVLRVSYRLGQIDRALGYKGPQRPDVIRRECREVMVADASAVVQSHGGYRDAPAVYAHWRRALREESVEQFEVLDLAESARGADGPQGINAEIAGDAEVS